MKAREKAALPFLSLCTKNTELSIFKKCYSKLLRTQNVTLGTTKPSAFKKVTYQHGEKQSSEQPCAQVHHCVYEAGWEETDFLECSRHKSLLQGSSSSHLTCFTFASAISYRASAVFNSAADAHRTPRACWARSTPGEGDLLSSSLGSRELGWLGSLD